jgi:Putative beta-barrel porin 2
MRPPLQNSYVLGICCVLLGLAVAGPAHGAALGQAGRATGFPSTAGRTPPSLGQTEDTGLGIFSSIPFHVTLTVRGGYDDNVSTTSGSPQGSAFVNSTIGITYNFGSPRTQLSLQLGGGITDYFDRPGNTDPDYNAYLGLSLKHNFTPRLILNVVAYAAYQAEPDFGIGTGFNRRSGNYFYTSDKFTLSYLWTPRFSTATSYNFSALVYDTGANGVGSFENRIENTFGNEFRFLIWPTTTVVAEYRIQFTSYLDSDADAVGNYLLAGFDHSFSPRLHLSFRGGLQLRSLDSTQLVPASIALVNGVLTFVPAHTIHQSTDSSSPYFESTVTYVLGQTTSVTWTERYGIEEPDIPGQPGRTTFRTGLEAKHNWTPRISSRLAVFYSHDHYGPRGPTPAFDEDSIDAATSLRYAITRSLGAEIGYNYTDIISGVNLRGYSRNRVYGGVDFSF